KIIPLLPAKLQKFWQNSILSRNSNELSRYLATTNNKLGKFIDYELFLNVVDRKPTISFEQILDDSKIFIANLGSCSEVLKKYFSVYLSIKMSQAIFAQAKRPKEDRKPCLLVIDEFQRVSSEVFDTLLSEVRAFNASIVIANQYTNQLAKQMQDSIEANIGTKIFMRTQSKDDTDFASDVLGEGVTPSDLVNLPTGVSYVKTLVNGVPQDAMSVKIAMVEGTRGTKTELEFAKDSSHRYGEEVRGINASREDMHNIIYTSSDPREFEKLLAKRTERPNEKVQKGDKRWI
ncbi:type IV secretion system DNA-binding domain-containing protein, partial [candidate division WWE3 bacterium]|nr:type IV secretion system DNA-binding domain-containing protein [candidate division WWE3 bacterium]